MAGRNIEAINIEANTHPRAVKTMVYKTTWSHAIRMNRYESMLNMIRRYLSVYMYIRAHSGGWVTNNKYPSPLCAVL
jgi:hypothetical protein